MTLQASNPIPGPVRAATPRAATGARRPEIDADVPGDASCWLCGSRETVPVHEIAWERRVPVSACRDCGFVFQATPLGESEQRAYYRGGDVFHEHGPDSRLGRLVARRHDFLRAHLADWLDASRRRSVLDVGCGYGDFLAGFDERAWHRIGLELNARRAAHGRRAFGATVHEETLAEWRRRGDRVDLCTAFGLVEHVTDPLGLLSDVRRVLEPGGHFVANVPDLADPLVAISDFFCIEHCGYYTERTFHHLLERAGFEILATTRLTPDYPDVAVLARPTAAAHGRPHARDPEEARRAIDGVRDYTRRRAALVRSIRERLAAGGLLAHPERLAIYGAGVHTRLLVRAIPELRDVRVFFDSDRDRWGESFLDGTVHPVERAAELGVDAIVISSRAFEGEIARSLEGRLPSTIALRTLYA